MNFFTLFHPATEELIAFLNQLLQIDPEAVTGLMEKRVPCNAGLCSHPTVQVVRVTDPPVALVGLLGLLNGFCGVFLSGPKEGWGPITAVYDEEGLITEFRLTENKE